MTGRRLPAVALAAVLTLLTLGALAGHSRLSGPVLLDLGDDHGVHLGDLGVLALYVAGLVLCRRLARD
ncbi:MAG: hypothetical protein PGN07_08460 [Aeromicrobium erythreum]